MTTFGLKISAGSVIGMRGRRDRAVARRCQMRGDAAHERRVDQRLVALHVDDDRVVAPAETRRHFRETVGARRMVGAREYRVEAVVSRRVEHFLRVRRDQHLLRARFARALRDAHDHRFAADVRERLVGQTRRREAGRHDGDKRMRGGVDHRIRNGRRSGRRKRLRARRSRRVGHEPERRKRLRIDFGAHAGRGRWHR
ncbi:hypothetical protein OKW27_005186 [Paraburkholderia sp. 35.1]